MGRTILLSTLDHSKVPLELMEIAAVKIHYYKLCADTFGIVMLCCASKLDSSVSIHPYS